MTAMAVAGELCWAIALATAARRYPRPLAPCSVPQIR
jgi:hypothetical protein